MAIDVRRYDDPQAVIDLAEPFLARDPILNNHNLTLLAARIVHPEPGRYWIAFEGDQVVGMAMQSPFHRPVTLSAMPDVIAAAMGAAIAVQGDDVPGVYGEARLAARFAAEWAECRKIGARPDDGHRIYQALQVREGPTASGQMERATPADFARVRDGAAAFMSEIGEPAELASQFAERTIAARQVWLWNDGGLRSVAAVTAPAHATVRVRMVYTPPEHRRHGYADALVRTLTRERLRDGLRPMLYADLANPTSNGIYRRIGYEAVAEIVRYRFGTSDTPHP